MRQRPCANPAFTLIELLVVISIIALLVAILLPALKQARHTAQAAVCLSNQRQLGLAFAMYANDREGFLPLYYSPGPGGAPWGETLYSEHYLPASDVFYCPAWAPWTYEHADLITTSFMGHFQWTYGMPLYGRNLARFDFMYQVPGESNLVSHIVLPQIDDPSKTFLLADSLNHTKLDSGIQVLYLYISTSAVHLRHGDGAHALMADGSAHNKKPDYFRDAYSTWMISLDGDMFN